MTDAAGNIDTADDAATLDTTVPTVGVEITTDADNSGHINASELEGTEGKINAHVTLGDTVKVGDTLVVKDQSGKELFNGAVTEEMLRDGLDVELTLPEGNNGDVKVTAEVTDAAGNIDTADDAATLEMEPGIIVSKDNLKTDESYTSDGSQEAPDGGEGDSASSNTDSGTLTVNTYGQSGSLIITVGDRQYSFTLDADGTLVGNQSTSFDTQYGTITLANGEDGIIYTYTQTKNFSHSKPGDPDEAATAESFTVQVEDSNGNASESQTITVTIEDDAPVFTEESSSYQEVTNSEEYWTSTDTIYFSNTNLSGNNDELTLSNGDRLSFQVGHIKFDEDRQGVSKDNITLDTNGTIYIDKDNGLGIHTESDRADRYWDSWGREQTKVDNDPLDTVDDNILNDRDHNQGRLDEIGYYDWELNQAEAIIIDLQGKTAINMHITLNGFKSDPHGEGVEKAIFIFYKDGEIVATKTLDGTTQATFTDMPAGGFDKVVIAAMHNGTSQGAQTDNSDFAIGSITFNEFDNPPVRTLTGDLEANSADGIKSYGIDVQALADLGLTSEGAPIIYSWNDSGTLVASANGETVFELSLNTDTGAWTLIQYQEYDGNLNLPFTATDGDGDVTSLDIAIEAPVQPSTTRLDVYESGLEGGSGDEATATASTSWYRRKKVFLWTSFLRKAVETATKGRL